MSAAVYGAARHLVDCFNENGWCADGVYWIVTDAGTYRIHFEHADDCVYRDDECSDCSAGSCYDGDADSIDDDNYWRCEQVEDQGAYRALTAGTPVRSELDSLKAQARRIGV